MHYEIHIDRHSHLATVSIAGDCSVEDMRTIQHAVAHTPGFDPTLAQVCDFSGVTSFDASVLDLISLARTTPFAAGGARAYIGGPAWVFGMLRKFALASETVGRKDVQIFRDRAAALAWIKARHAERAASDQAQAI